MPWFEREKCEVVVIDHNLSPLDYLLARMRDPTTEEHGDVPAIVEIGREALPTLSR
jgi:hypothetical protein